MRSFSSLLGALALCLATNLTAQAQSTMPGPDPTDTHAVSPDVARNFSYIIGMQAGNNLRKQLPHALGDIDLEALMTGLEDALAGRKPAMDVAEMTFWSGKFLKKLEARTRARGVLNAQRGAAFRAEFAEREDVLDAGGGILYRELTNGAGRQPGLGQTVRIHYVGKQLNGQAFDSSIERGEPLRIAMRDVIPGWQNALSLMQVGDRWEVVLPPEQAYGKSGTSVIGPSETLIFELELLEIE